MRRTGTGFDHHRPENRHRDGPASCSALAARGHDTSTAARIAATSSSDGAGDTLMGLESVISHRSQRHVPVLAGRELLFLRAEHLEAGDEDGPGVGRVDHIVDEPALGGDVRVQPPLGVLLHELGPLRLGVRRLHELAPVHDLHRSRAPITASSAEGQA